MSSARDKRNVLVLAVCQTFFNTGRALVLTTSPLVGYGLAANKALSTLPISLMMVGNVLTAIPASLFMQRVGRRFGFFVGGLIGTAGCTLTLFALYLSDFFLFCLGVLIYGAFGGFAQLYRFAAADVAPEHFKSKAISLVLAGGVVAAFLGPELAKYGRELFSSIEFFGAYALLVVVTLLAALIVTFVNIPKISSEQAKGQARSMMVIMIQPTFIVAVLSAMVGFAVMSLLMTATPLAMFGAQHHFNSTAFVIEWHILGMYGPGFFTGSLIKRFGVISIIVVGLLLEVTATMVALSGQTVWAFWSALLLLGVGWNFAFTGGSTLLTKVYRPIERAKVQGVNDFLVFGATAIASLSSGTLFHYYGWEVVNFAALPLIGIALLALIWLALSRRAIAPATSW